MKLKTEIFKIIISTNIILVIINSSASNLFISALPPEKDQLIGEDEEDHFHSLDGVTMNCLGIPVNLLNVFNNIFLDITKARDVRFYLFSRDKSRNATSVPQYETIVAGDDFNINEINFKIERKTVVLVHGFLSSGQEDWLHEMKDALLLLSNVNVIIIDWQNGSNTWNYYAASYNTQVVGTQIARFLDKLKNEALVLNPKLKCIGSLHFIGHSLGSHISAYASYRMQKYDDGKAIKWIVNRITGLDPAQPCFRNADLALRLDKSDALFVDAIHTNARSIILLGFGLPEDLGHIDYYPNGGQMQLGCDDIDTSSWGFLMYPKSVLTSAICSHGRSYELFTDSIMVKISKKCTYVGKPWNRTYENLNELVNEDCSEKICPEMGINAIKYYLKAEGSYFVPTSNVSHFCDLKENDKKLIVRQLEADEQLENSYFSLFGFTLFGK